jgi:hypothetical protein
MPYADIEKRREAVRKSKRKARELRGPVPLGRPPSVSEEQRKETKKRAWYASKARYPERDSARNILNSAVYRGVVKPQPCWVCGDRAEAHHPDYSSPLDVVWLCNSHHREAHELCGVGL